MEKKFDESRPVGDGEKGGQQESSSQRANFSREDSGAGERGYRRKTGDRVIPKTENAGAAFMKDRRPRISRDGDTQKSYGERPTYGDRSDRSERKPYGDRSERPAFGDRSDRSDRSERKPYGERSERPAFGDRSDRSERKPYGERSERPAFGDDKRERHSFNPNFTSDNKRRDFGGDRSERKPYGDRSERPAFGDRSDRSERKPYGDRSERPAFGDRSDRSERKPYGDRSERPAFGDRSDRSERKPYGDRSERPAFGDRSDRSERKPYGDRSERPAFGDRSDRSERKPYGDRSERPAFGDRSDRSERKPYGDRSERPAFGDDKRERHSFNPNFTSDNKRRDFGGDRSERKPYGDRSERPAFGDRSDRSDRSERKPYGDRSERPAFGDRSDRSYKKPYGESSDRTERRPRTAKPDGENYPRYNNDSDITEMRLNRYISMSGLCSRREADEYIKQGLITVNDVVVTELGTKIQTSDKIFYNGTQLMGEKKVYIVMNKPKGYVTTVEDPNADRTVMDLLEGACKERVYPVGRLDKNTMGVLLITNDGDLTKKLTHPSFDKKKIYHATLNKNLHLDDMQKIMDGIELEDGMVNVDNISYVDENKNEIGLEIHSGRNRIIRRIFEQLGYDVEKLDRVYFAGLTKKSLTRGRWRFLTDREVTMLKSGLFE